MSSIAQIEANRLNAQKSTGPRTPEGKAASCRNATTHGLLSADVVVAGESEDEFQEHRRELMDDLRPWGATERLLADRFIAQAWRLRRVTRVEGRILEEKLGEYGILADRAVENGVASAPAAENGVVSPLPRRPFRGRGNDNRRRAAISSMFLTANDGLDVLRRYERAIERGFFAALRDLKVLQKDRRKNGRPVREDAGREEGRGVRGDAEKEEKTPPATFSAIQQEASALAGCETNPIGDSSLTSNLSPLTSPRRRKMTTWHYGPEYPGGCLVEERWVDAPQVACETNPIAEETSRDAGDTGDKKEERGEGGGERGEEKRGDAAVRQAHRPEQSRGGRGDAEIEEKTDLTMPGREPTANAVAECETKPIDEAAGMAQADPSGAGG